MYNLLIHFCLTQLYIFFNSTTQTSSIPDEFTLLKKLKIMDTQLPNPEPQGLFQRNKNLIKGFMISFLILALLIPTFFVRQLISER